MATARVIPRDLRPDRLTFSAFVGVVLIGGANLVAVRLGNQDLPPFFGAGIRFAFAGLLLLVLIVVRGIPLPRGQALVGSVIYGLLGFAGAFALGYWALVELPAGMAGVIMSSVPLLTLFLARIHGLEAFQWRGLVGGVLTIAGIWILVTSPVTARVPIGSVLAMAGAAVCLAEAGIVVKKFPPCHPVATNGLGMGLGTVVLLLVSVASRESWSIPTRQTTWLVLGHLVLLGSVALFGLYLFVLKRWTASGASYQFVLMPFVAALLAAWLADEPISGGLVVGGVIVLAGVYMGALSTRTVPVPGGPEQEALALRCST